MKKAAIVGFYALAAAVFVGVLVAGAVVEADTSSFRYVGF